MHPNEGTRQKSQKKKKQNKTLNKVKISNLLNKAFKVMTIKIFN